jgi:nitroreductase
MKDVLHLLHTRNSAPKLTDPGPSAPDLDQILRAALRAPDHARLRPWRFITVQEQRREDLGRLFLASLLRRNAAADQAARDKALAAPLRAPMVMVVVCRLSEHPKVPHYEQRLSAGCAAQGALLAAEALGLAGIWRTGDVAFDRVFMSELGLADNEEIIGFLYLGTRQGPPKPLPELDPGEFNKHW